MQYSFYNATNGRKGDPKNGPHGFDDTSIRRRKPSKRQGDCVTSHKYSRIVTEWLCRESNHYQLTLRSHFQFNQAQEIHLLDKKNAKESSGTLQRVLIERIKTRRPPIKPLIFKKTGEAQPNLEIIEDSNARPDPRVSQILNIIAETNSPGLIWHTYQRAVRLSIPVPSIFLDRISRVIIRRYAPTRETFLRLHEVLHVLRQQGHMKTWQWNSLIYHAALGLRKLHTKDYQAALDIFREMQSLQAAPENHQHCEPDIYTYTTLLSIAIRTGVTECVDHAYSLMRDSNLQQDRIARLAIIPYYVRNRNLKAVRAVAHEFARKSEDIGIDGINAYAWAFGRHGHLEVVEEIYQVLRSNLSLEDTFGEKPAQPISLNAIDGYPAVVQSASTAEKEMFKPPKDAADPFSAEWYSTLIDVDNLVFEFSTFNPGAEAPNRYPSRAESEPDNRLQTGRTRFFRRPHRQVNGDLVIMRHHVPNNITYTLCIQVYAYHRNLRQALQIFRDLITTPDMERPWDFTAQTYRAFHKAYRALFLGFVRHSSSLITDNLLSNDDAAEQERQWTEEALEFVFQSFLTMDPEELRPNDRTVGWIMRAFANSSGHDPNKLDWVWRSLEDRFGHLRVPRLYRSLVPPSPVQKPDNSQL
jgi:PPR repeat